jgi:hypothetical protein
MYFGKVRIPFSQSSGENPGVAAAVAILASMLVGSIFYVLSLRGNRV